MGLCVRLGDYPVDEEIEANTRAAADALRDAGAQVEEIELPWTRERLLRTIAPHFASQFGAGVVEVDDQHRDLLYPYTRQYADQMRWVAQHASFRDGLPAEIRMRQELAEAMAPFDALICPTTAIPAFPAGEDMLDGCVIDGENLGPPVDLAMTLPFNANNRCPVLAAPSGHAQCGVPTGIQIVGHPYDDPTVFRVGKALETVRSSKRRTRWPELAVEFPYEQSECPA